MVSFAGYIDLGKWEAMQIQMGLSDGFFGKWASCGAKGKKEGSNLLIRVACGGG